MKAILIFIVVICSSVLLMFSQIKVKMPEPLHPYPSNINNIKLNQYVFKNNPRNNLSFQMHHLLIQMGKLSKRNVFYLSIGVSKDSIIYVIVQDWDFWSLIDKKNDYERVFGVYKDRNTEKFFVILNSGGETSKSFILNLFKKNGRYINFERAPYPGPFSPMDHFICTTGDVDYFLGFVIDNNLVLHDFRIRGHKTDYK